MKTAYVEECNMSRIMRWIIMKFIFWTHINDHKITVIFTFHNSYLTEQKRANPSASINTINILIDLSPANNRFD